jgi:hypothetical protein
LDWDVYGRTSTTVCGANVQNYRIQFRDVKRQIRFAKVRYKKSLGS